MVEIDLPHAVRSLAAAEGVDGDFGRGDE